MLQWSIDYFCSLPKSYAFIYKYRFTTTYIYKSQLLLHNIVQLAIRLCLLNTRENEDVYMLSLKYFIKVV